MDCYSYSCWYKNTFDPSVSSTYQDSSTTFTMGYGSGYTTGKIGADVLSIAGVQCNSCQIGLASQVSESFSSSHFDGIAGLGFPAIAEANAQPFMLTMSQSDKIKNIFCFYMTRNSNEQGSALVIGEVPSEEADEFKTGKMIYTPLLEENYWKVKVNGFGMLGQSTGSWRAIVDSGTSFIVGSKAAVGPIVDAIGEPDCDRVHEYPALEVTIEGNVFKIPPASYIFRQDGECIVAMHSVSLPIEQAGFDLVLGDVFMRQFYTCFDGENNRIGLAEAK